VSRDRLQILTLGGIPSSGDAPHLLASLTSDDLNVNIMRFTGEEGIEEHVNREVDVLLVALEGEGLITVDSIEATLAAGQAMIIPKGAARSIRCAGTRFAYVTCHGQRRGMMPTVRSRS
jgi:mannose-6-phosphate isomerase-like protein (cupin superfamily)